ncbi:helix-turn-helix domain-containing protein [Nonomuraea sp. NPDC050451]|uniref:helix-turn-helix domain-containing protein n=1 Tax=Nonomuraea sp. NPDC050451 TaxID=3364364 RepID=UPI0037B9BB03
MAVSGTGYSIGPLLEVLGGPRPAPAMHPGQVGHARALLTQPDVTIASIARLLGVSRATIYKYVPQLKSGGDRQAIAAPRHVPNSPPKIEPRHSPFKSAR